MMYRERNPEGGTISAEIADAFREIAGEEHVVEDGLVRYRLGPATPRLAVLPADEEEASRILAAAAAERLGIVPWGSGCHQTVGYPPSRYDVALDLGRMNRLLEHEPDDMTATAQAGIRLGDLQRLLGERGQFLPLDPPLAEQASLGGALALGLSGPLRTRYGTARDLVLGARVMLADGTLTRAGAKVVKNATAYDITKLYLGSCGTLGVILEATLRLYPLPAKKREWRFNLPDLTSGQALAIRILGSHLSPSRVELLEAGAWRACGGSGEGATLLVSCAGIAEALEQQEAVLTEFAQQTGVGMTVLENRDSTWQGVRDLFWAGRGGTDQRAVWRAGVLPSECAKAMQAIQEACRGKGEVAIAATVAAGGLRGEVRARTADELAEAVRAARDAVEGLGGFLVVQAASPEALEGFDVWGGTPEWLGVMRRMKAAFDPNGILNPGRYVGRI